MIKENDEHKVLGFLALVASVATDVVLGVGEILGATAKAVADLRDEKVEEDLFMKIVEED